MSLPSQVCPTFTAVHNRLWEHHWRPHLSPSRTSSHSEHETHMQETLAEGNQTSREQDKEPSWHNPDDKTHFPLDHCAGVTYGTSHVPRKWLVRCTGRHPNARHWDLGDRGEAADTQMISSGSPEGFLLLHRNASVCCQCYRQQKPTHPAFYRPITPLSTPHLAEPCK